MKKQVSKGIKYLPITLSVAYLLFTVVLYALGPFAWDTHNAFLFYALLFVYIVALFLGYYKGINKADRKIDTVKPVSGKKRKKFIKTISVLSVIHLIMTVISIFRSYGYTSLNFAALIKDLFWGITHPGEGYNRIYERRFLTGADVVGGRLFTVVALLWDFVGFAVLLIGIFEFKKFKLPTKTVIVISCLLTILFYFSIGTNIGVFRILLAVLLSFIVDRLRKRNRKNNKTQKIWIIAVVVIGVVGFIAYFVHTMKNRGGILNWDEPYYNIGGIKLNKDSVFFKILPESLYIPFISLSGYLTQGYYGFSLCLSQPWLPTYGFGHSMYLVDLLSEYGLSIDSLTYQYRIEQVYGWDSRIQWASMFTWFANDFGFVGVIFVMFLIGYILALVYNDALKHNNTFAKLLLFYLALQILFIPCNNQLFQSSITYFSFITTFVLWIGTRGRVNAVARQKVKMQEVSGQHIQSNE